MTKRVTIDSEQSNYNEFLKKHLDEAFFASGGELKDKLVERFTVTNAYARKIVNRATTAMVLKSSKPYTFGKGQFIYFSNEIKLDAKAIKKVCQKNRPPLYRLLQVLENNNGIISFYDAMKITASPGHTSSTKVSTLEDMLKVLKKLNVVYDKLESGNRYIIQYEYPGAERWNESVEQSLISRCFSKMIIDSSLIPDILRWLIKSHLIGEKFPPIYRSKKFPGTGFVHNNLWWDAFGYTSTTGINTVYSVDADTTEKQTLVALDIVLSTSYSQEDLDGFYSRVQIHLNSVKKGTRKVLPVIIYKNCSIEVLNKIGRLGFLSFEIGAVFGTRIYDVIQKLTYVNNAISIGEQDVNESVNDILKIIKESGHEDALKDLKGTLFECLMYPVLKNLFPDARMDRGKILKEKSEDGNKVEYEYDYIIFSSTPPETVFVELKGYTSNAMIPLGNKDKKNSLKWFFNRTLPFGKSQMKKESGEGRTVKGVYITTAGFFPDGHKFITEQNTGRNKSLVMNTGYEYNGLIQLLEERGLKKEIQIIKKFYTKSND